MNQEDAGGSVDDDDGSKRNELIPASFIYKQDKFKSCNKSNEKAKYAIGP